MVDVRGDVLRPPHSTTPAAVKANENKKKMSIKVFLTTLSCLWHFLVVIPGQSRIQLDDKKVKVKVPLA